MSSKRDPAAVGIILFGVLLVAFAGWAIGNFTGHEKTITVGANGRQIVEPAEIQGAPAFAADQLDEQPKEDWLTNGGSLKNQRFSPLNQINDGNIDKVKGVWITHLKRSAVAAKYSAESQPIVYKGTMYVATGADDVFAVDVGTGKIQWQYKAGITDKNTSVCCGWTSRGVAIGEGMVYIGQLDGQLVALDQKTGKKEWSTTIEKWQNGYTITSAPLYYNGRVYTGVSGGEYQARGRLTAVNAKTGKIDWRFYTVPGPGEVGHETWPQDNDSWQHGGAPIWQTPAVDPKLGMLYFSTGNASPDDNGHAREGDNLFTASIVAIDADTGKYRWHYQQVHHDIWDYDSPNPVILFDAEIGGRQREAIAETNKTGWTYVLDRKTGKPIVPIEERPVPQNAYQKTAKTQPFPQWDPVVPHTVSDDQYAEIKGLGAKSPETKKLDPVHGEIFTPLELKKMVVVAPSPAGGVNWPPSSYNPDTHMLYVCALETAGGYSVNLTKPPGTRAAPYLASVWTINGFIPNPGVLAAIDVTTGRTAWRAEFDDACYSGSVATGGNLVFVGRNTGELEAYKADSGEKLWSFQTGAGANNTPTIFEQGGKQYIAFYAGGNGLAATKHGDNLWLFGLDGTLGPAKAAGTGQGIQHAGEDETKSDTKKGNADAGEAVFADNCSTCHGADGTGGNGGPDLTGLPSAKVEDNVLKQVEKGGGGMPAFEGVLTPQQIADVTSYVLKLTGGK
ncbi:MAG: PQQ-binding-like beta-propeller repeat protein [Solirubrobacteraceae bacterium]